MADGKKSADCSSEGSSRKMPRPAPELSKGKIIGGFRLVQPIGQGGMGLVWEAEQLSVGNRRVAVKFVRPDQVTRKHLELFKREARAGGRLSHDGIVRVFDYGEEAGLAWIAMEYVETRWTLRDSLNDISRQPGIPPGYDLYVAQLIVRIADAMEAAHRAGVIHRDLKPQNILITSDDSPKVTDFGLARIVEESSMSKTGDIAGTPAYMSPEQAEGDRGKVDHRSDVFSLGVVLYEALTFKNPFSRPGQIRPTEAIASQDPASPDALRPSIPPWLAQVCMKAMAWNRHERFQSMADLASAIRAASPPKVMRQSRETEPTGVPARGLVTQTFQVGSVLVLLYIAIGGWMKLDIGVRAQEAKLAPSNPVIVGEITYLNPETARVDADDVNLTRYFPWSDPIPRFLLLAMTMAAFGALGGCIRSFLRTPESKGAINSTLTALLLGTVSGLMLTGLAYSIAPTLLFQKRTGLLALTVAGLLAGCLLPSLIRGIPRGRSLSG